MLEKAYEDLRDDQETDEKPERPEVDFDDLHWRIDQAEAGEDTSSSISTRERACSEASQDMASMAEGDLGDLEDNQPDSSAPEDEQPEHSALQPIGEFGCKPFLFTSYKASKNFTHSLHSLVHFLSD